MTLNIPYFFQPKFTAIEDKLETGIIQKFTSLDEINTFVNNVQYVTDQVEYGVSDRWSTPKEFFANNAGDCEDFAIAKYALALENGYIKESFELVLVWDNEKDMAHMVLVRREEFVLDCQFPDIYTVDKAKPRYKFLGKVTK